jgi:hypothetical protein
MPMKLTLVARRLCPPGLVASVLVVAGCGSSAQAPPATGDRAPVARTASAATAPARPARARTAFATTAPAQPIRAPRGAISRDRGTVKARGIKAPDTDAANSTGADGANPCRLVTRAQAAAIIGKPVAVPQLGTQGPTCIYRSRAAKQFVTLAMLQTTSTAKVGGSRGAIALRVGGRKAVCVNSGGQHLRVTLAQGKMLDVAGPCPIAAAFARRALSRLTS